jgi:hypothetical protein
MASINRHKTTSSIFISGSPFQHERARSPDEILRLEETVPTHCSIEQIESIRVGLKKG